MATRKISADDAAQYRRFVEEARKSGVDESDPDAMDRAFERVRPGVKPTPSGKVPTKGRSATR